MKYLTDHLLAKKWAYQQRFGICCFNNSYKISVNEFDIWMRILSKIENSVLWLKIGNELAKKNIRIAAEKRGVDPSRIIFAEF